MAKPKLNRRAQVQRRTRAEKIYRDLCVFTHELADQYDLDSDDMAHMLFHMMADWHDRHFYRVGQVIKLKPRQRRISNAQA